MISKVFVTMLSFGLGSIVAMITFDTAKKLIMVQDNIPLEEELAVPALALLAEVRIERGFFDGCVGFVSGRRDGQPVFDVTCTKNKRQLVFKRVDLSRADYTVTKP